MQKWLFQVAINLDQLPAILHNGLSEIEIQITSNFHSQEILSFKSLPPKAYDGPGYAWNCGSMSPGIYQRGIMEDCTLNQIGRYGNSEIPGTAAIYNTMPPLGWLIGISTHFLPLTISRALCAASLPCIYPSMAMEQSAPFFTVSWVLEASGSLLLSISHFRAERMGTCLLRLSLRV